MNQYALDKAYMNMAIIWGRLSRAERKQVFIKDKYESRFMLPLSLSYDHRVIDGAEGARFCAHLKESLGKDFAYKLAV